MFILVFGRLKRFEIVGFIKYLVWIFLLLLEFFFFKVDYEFKEVLYFVKYLIRFLREVNFMKFEWSFIYSFIMNKLFL